MRAFGGDPHVSWGQKRALIDQNLRTHRKSRFLMQNSGDLKSCGNSLCESSATALGITLSALLSIPDANAPIDGPKVLQSSTNTSMLSSNPSCKTRTRLPNKTASFSLRMRHTLWCYFNLILCPSNQSMSSSRFVFPAAHCSIMPASAFTFFWR